MTEEADAGRMCSYALDVWLPAGGDAILRDERALLTVLRAAAEAGDAVVLAAAAHTFPNGAVTAVLVLSQSHLSVHTWPEHGSANVDLLTCGPLNGERMIEHLCAALAPAHVTSSRTERNVRRLS